MLENQQEMDAPRRTTGLITRVLVIGLARLRLSCSNDPRRQSAKYMASGSEYLAAGRFQEAVIQFEMPVQNNPRSAEAHFQLARAHQGLNDREAAYRELTEAVSLESQKHKEAQLEMASLLLKRRQYSAAEQTAGKVLQLDPGNGRAHSILAQMYGLTGDGTSALRELQTAIRLDPKRVENYVAMAAIYLASGRQGEADDASQRAIAADPKSIEARIALGSALSFARGRLRLPKTRSLQPPLDPRAVLPKLLLGRLYATSGRPLGSREALQRAESECAAGSDAYRALGSYYAESGQLEKAVAEFKSLLDSKPKDPGLRMSLAEVLINLNRHQEAGTVISEVLRATPGDPEGFDLARTDSDRGWQVRGSRGCVPEGDESGSRLGRRLLLSGHISEVHGIA